MLIDCFTFFNEYDILEGRLEYLFDTVDMFVIVEATTTHSGQPKGLNFKASIDRYSKYLSKIKYFPVDLNTENLKFDDCVENNYNSDAWKLEKQQRNMIGNCLHEFASPSDYVMISDVDEIPTKHSIRVAKTMLKDTPSVCLMQDLYYYSFRYLHDDLWPGTVVTSVENILLHGAQSYRDNRWSMPIILRGGYHLSYWGGPEKVANKIANFAHQEFNTEENTDPRVIEDRIAQGKDIHGRTNHLCPVDLSVILPEISNVFARYQ